MLREINKSAINGWDACKYFLDENDDYHGLYQRFYLNGNLRTAFQYKNGYGRNIKKEYYRDGRIEELSTRVSHENNGVVIEFEY